MPWDVKRSGKNWKVVNRNSNKVMGTHTSKEKANKQIRAIHANYNSKK